MKKNKIIYQYSCPGTNVGDNALTIGLINSFKKYKNIAIHNFRLRGIQFTQEYINQINKECDMIIIGGGGLLHCSPSIRKKKDNNSGTLWEINPENIEKISVPIVIYAVGYNVFRGEEDLPHIAKKSITEMIRNAKIFSVRNDGSKQRLVKFLGRFSNKIRKIPDPGLYVDATSYKLIPNINKSIRIDRLNKNDINIAFQLAFDRVKHRYLDIMSFFEKIKYIVDYDFGTIRNITFWFVPHVRLDNVYLNRYLDNTFNKLPYLPKYEDCGKIMDFYKKMDIVIGMRGHANICPFGLGTPIISLVSHDKNKGFMLDVGMREFYVDINNDEKWEHNLLNKIKIIIHNKANIINRIKKSNKKMLMETNKVNNEIVELLNKT